MIFLSHFKKIPAVVYFFFFWGPERGNSFIFIGHSLPVQKRRQAAMAESTDFHRRDLRTRLARRRFPRSFLVLSDVICIGLGYRSPLIPDQS